MNLFKQKSRHYPVFFESILNPSPFFKIRGGCFFLFKILILGKVRPSRVRKDVRMAPLGLEIVIKNILAPYF